MIWGPGGSFARFQACCFLLFSDFLIRSSVQLANFDLPPEASLSVESLGPENWAVATEPIIGARDSKIYHLPNCPDYNKVSERNRAPFMTEAEAQAAVYRKAWNCPYESLKMEIFEGLTEP